MADCARRGCGDEDRILGTIERAVAVGTIEPTPESCFPEVCAEVLEQRTFCCIESRLEAIVNPELPVPGK